MRFHTIVAFTISLCSSALAATLRDVCTVPYVRSTLPTSINATTTKAIIIDPSSVTANLVYNVSASNFDSTPTGAFDYCNVTFAYSHAGHQDRVQVMYGLPSPDKFMNRYLSTGGGGFAINSAGFGAPAGVSYGAVVGATDGGFGGFDVQFNEVFPLYDGTPNLEALRMFGYQALRELGVLGKQLTSNFFKMKNNVKLYSYYQGCSEGGRQGWSQIQRFGNSFDGAITGAPAFRFSFQQTQHLYSNVVEKTVGYYPPACEFEKIVDEMIKACDPLDGKTDGVVSRTDLCKLQFNISSVVGKSYNCLAGGTGSPFGKGKKGKKGKGKSLAGMKPPVPAPAQLGTVTAQGVVVAQRIMDGLKDSQGRQVYFSYQPASSFVDGETQYNLATNSWGLNINGMGSEWISRFLWLQKTSNFSTLEGVTYDVLKNWMIQGWQTYQDTLETTWPDLTPYHTAGGKILHFHGESDDSIPAASSVRYHDSVRQVMYPGLSFNESSKELGKWYKLFLIPGAGHCGPNPLQANGPFPKRNLDVLIEWVEKGIEPVTLDAEIMGGKKKGEKQEICAWPLRPLWSEKGMECVYDQKSVDSWTYVLEGVPMHIY